MKRFDLAPLSPVKNIEMAVAYALPLGLGLFAALYALEIPWTTKVITSVVGFSAVLICVLFLTRPIPGSLTVASDGLRIEGANLRAFLPWESLVLDETTRLEGAISDKAALVFISDKRRLVCLTGIDGSLVVVSPHHPEEFIHAVKSANVLASAA